MTGNKLFFSLDANYPQYAHWHLTNLKQFLLENEPGEDNYRYNEKGII